MPPTTTSGRAEDGCEGWDYRSVLPYFKRAEDNQRFADDYHAYGGPLGVSMPVSALPICDAYIRAGQELGIPYNHDFNGKQQAGVGFYQLTQRNRRRSSASLAYLSPIRSSKNLTIRIGARVTRIVLEGKRAVGVEVATARALRNHPRRTRSAGFVAAPSARRNCCCSRASAPPAI